jgi:hypothetical protein
MQRSRLAAWQKWIPLTGVLFVVLYFIGFGLVSGPDNSDSDQKILDWYNDSGHQTMVIIGGYIFAVSVVALLLFMNRLRAVISEAEGDQPLFAPFIFSGGAIYAIALAVTGALITAVPAELKFGDTARVTNADVVRFLDAPGLTLLCILGVFPLIFAMFATACASMRYRVFPSWFSWLCLVCGIVLVPTAVLPPITFLALGIWMLAGSWVLMKRQPGSASS